MWLNSVQGGHVWRNVWAPAQVWSCALRLLEPPPGPPALLVGKDHCLSDPDTSAPSVSLKSSATFGRVQKVLQKKPGECAHRSANPSQMDLLGCALFLPTLRLILQLACLSLRWVLLSSLWCSGSSRALSSAAPFPSKSRTLPEIESLLRICFCLSVWTKLTPVIQQSQPLLYRLQWETGPCLTLPSLITQPTCSGPTGELPCSL